MISSPPSKKPQPFHFDMPPYNQAKMRRPSIFVGIPEPMLLLIGHCVSGWSFFERDFDKTISGLLLNSPQIPDNWHLLSFPKRRNLFAKEAARIFEARPAVVAWFNTLLTDAKALHTKRNLLVHGRIFVKIVTGEVAEDRIPGSISLHCVGVEAKKIIHEDFSLEALEVMRYDLAHLCGRMGILHGEDNLASLNLALHDKRALRGLQRTLRSAPTPPTDVPQHGSHPWVRQRIHTKLV